MLFLNSYGFVGFHLMIRGPIMITGNGSTGNDKKDRNEIRFSGSTLSDESEVIELIDVVRKEALPNSPYSPAGLSEREEEILSEDRSEIDLDELTKEMKILSENMPDPDQDSEEDSLTSSDFDFETHEEPYPEASAEFPDEDLEEIMSKLEQEGRTCGPLSSMPVEGLPGMTEEKIEALIREVVEKAVRETMARVAEKVIKEAIESLKESLKP